MLGDKIAIKIMYILETIQTKHYIKLFKINLSFDVLDQFLTNKFKSWAKVRLLLPASLHQMVSEKLVTNQNARHLTLSLKQKHYEANLTK